MAERIIIAFLVGAAEAAVVWAISTGLRMEHVWPGTVLGFAFGMGGTLLILRGGR